MKLERSMIFAGTLFCLALLFNPIISPALAGQGCGTNWMGDTSHDTDFWVSKNQNLGASSTSVSKEGAPIKAGQASLIKSLTPDRPSPQMVGTAITWTANVSDQLKDGILYDFYLKGPSTSGLPEEKTGWTAENSWTWNTTGAGAGNYEVEVRVKDKASTREFDDRQAENYLIEETTKNGSASAADSHPVSAASESATVPKLAPDERPKTATAYDSTRPNMDMPVTKPIPLASESTAEAAERVGGVDAKKESTAVSDSTAPASTPVDSHPLSRTAKSIMKKPRLAPDERPKPTTKSNSGPNMDMPVTNPTPLVSASTGGAEKQAETATTADEYSQEDQASPEPEKPDVMDVGGKWTIGLKEIGKSMDLILIQSGESVMGSGTLNDQGNKIPLMASGSVAGNSLKLDVKTVVGKYVNQIDKRFNLDMVKVDRQISGSYDAYSGDSLDSQGKITASRFGN